MNTAKLEIAKSSLPMNKRSLELMHHLHLVSDAYTEDLRYDEVMETDDCKVYHKGVLVCTTSTHELNILIKTAQVETMEPVIVKTNEGEFFAAVHKDLINRTYVGVLTDSYSRVSAFVKTIDGVLWGIDSYRLFQIDFQEDVEMFPKNAQDAIRYVNKQRAFLVDKPDSIILF